MEQLDQEDERLYALLRVFSHDLGSIASGLEGLLPLLRAALAADGAERPGVGASPEELLAALASTAGRASAIYEQVRTILALSPAERGAPEALALEASVAGAMLQFSGLPPGQPGGIALRSSLEPGFTIRADPPLLRQALLIQLRRLAELCRRHKLGIDRISVELAPLGAGASIRIAAQGVVFPAALSQDLAPPVSGEGPLDGWHPNSGKEGLWLALLRRLAGALGGELALLNQRTAPQHVAITLELHA